MVLPLILFTVFTLLASVGAFWIGKAQRSLATGIGLGLGTLLFMGAIFALLVYRIWPLLAG